MCLLHDCYIIINENLGWGREGGLFQNDCGLYLGFVIRFKFTLQVYLTTLGHISCNMGTYIQHIAYNTGQYIRFETEGRLSIQIQ